MRVTRKVTQTEGNTVTQDNPIMDALVNPIKRARLVKICDSLKAFNQLDNVYYGCGKYSTSMTDMSGLIECTKR